MVFLLAGFNRLIPFATPGTPLLQDILHLCVLCVALYFAPQIQQRLRGDDSSQASDPHLRRAIHVDLEVEPAQNDTLGSPAPDPEDDPQQDQAGPAPGIEEDNEPDAGENGVAHPELPETSDVARQRNVGAKKAKSLARKDQRRAYHEFMRAQGDSQRAKDAEGAEAREEALAAERERRKVAAAQLEAQKAAEREAKRLKDEKTREENARRIDFVLQSVKEELDAHRTCDLFRVARAAGNDVGEEWVEQILKASGMVGLKGDVMTMITETGWVARVTMRDMVAVYQSAALNNVGDEEGRVTDDIVANLLTKRLHTPSVTNAG